MDQQSSTLTTRSKDHCPVADQSSSLMSVLQDPEITHITLKMIIPKLEANDLVQEIRGSSHFGQ